MQSSKRGIWKGYHLSIEGIRKGYLFREKWNIKGSEGVGARGGTSPYKHLLSIPPGLLTKCITPVKCWKQWDFTTCLRSTIESTSNPRQCLKSLEMFKETFYLFNSLKTFPSCLVTPRQNTTSFAFFPDFSHLLCDSDHFFRDPWVPLTFFPAATLAVYHFPIKIREVKIVLTQHSANAHTKPFKPWEAKTVWACLSHAEGFIWRKLFLESVRSEPIFIWIPAQLNWNNVLLICNSGKF